VRDRGVEIRLGFKVLFDCLYETIQAAEGVEFLFVADTRGVESLAQHRERFVVRFQRHWKRMPVFAAVCE
jgi:hypothetical protein